MPRFLLNGRPLSRRRFPSAIPSFPVTTPPGASRNISMLPPTAFAHGNLQKPPKPRVNSAQLRKRRKWFQPRALAEPASRDIPRGSICASFAFNASRAVADLANDVRAASDQADGSWSSCRPISRSWHETSGEAHSARIRTVRPALTCGKGESVAVAADGSITGFVVAFAFISTHLRYSRLVFRLTLPWPWQDISCPCETSARRPALAAGHMNLHRGQIEKIIEGLGQ